MSDGTRWRDEKLLEQTERQVALFGHPDCTRCGGRGEVVWFGHLGQGGSLGPCIKCRPLAAAQFAEHHNPFKQGRR